jgi:hypothetical protein
VSTYHYTEVTIFSLWRKGQSHPVLSILAVFLVAIFLSGCAQNPKLRANSPVVPSNGVLLMTLGYRELYPPFHTYSIRIRAINSSSAKAYFYSFPLGGMFGAAEDAIKIPNGLLMLSALVMPPGEYEIYEYSASSDVGPISPQAKYSPTTPIRLRVNAGEVAYLGSVALENIPGERRKYQYVVSDELTRDRQLLENIKPELGTWSVRKTVLSETPIGPLTRY